MALLRASIRNVFSPAQRIDQSHLFDRRTGRLQTPRRSDPRLMLRLPPAEGGRFERVTLKAHIATDLTRIELDRHTEHQPALPIAIVEGALRGRQYTRQLAGCGRLTGT